MQNLDPQRDFGKNPVRSAAEQTTTSHARREELCDVISDQAVPQPPVSNS